MHRKVARTTGVNADMLSAFCAYHEKVPCKHGTERCETTNKRYVADVKKKKKINTGFTLSDKEGQCRRAGQHCTESQGIWGPSPTLSLGHGVIFGYSGCPGGEMGGS